MIPDSQSSDAAPPQGKTYRSTPSVKQVRFPMRRSKVRREQGKGKGKGKAAQSREKNASLKQQTLTQMDFVSSFSEEVTLSDSDDESDTSLSGANKPDILSKGSSEAQPKGEKGEKEEEEIIRGSQVIQDSYASPDDNLSTQASPLKIQPIKLRDTLVLSPSRVRFMEPQDVVKASPRRRAHWSSNPEGSKRLKPSQEDDMPSPTRVRFLTKDVDDREIPDSDEEYEELEVLEEDEVVLQDTFATGHETQLVLEELASLEYPERNEEQREQEPSAVTSQVLASTLHSSIITSSGGSSNNKPAPPIESTDPLPTTKTSLQSPTISQSPNATSESHHSTDLSQRPHSQFFESQRVPLHILQSFTPVSARTDILLPVPSKVLSSLVDGSTPLLHLPYRIPELVARFWLLDQETLRYMACVQPGEPSGPNWDYHVDQVYELNNPVEERDMQEEGWVTGQVRRYIYLPPAIVGQLLWNLRCATFDRTEQENDAENTQEKNTVEALDWRSPESSMPLHPASHSQSRSTNHDTGQPSSLLFQDHGSSLVTIPANAVFDSSPLLTKSQMLSDSLLSDDV
ncbi:hypothetical protein N5P37_011957 [Trichoderma harzianum]|uniref:Uncharacterized protein n=1 Tax=Trichoderma harzianum CBS 226.95 TaxID=983964 RepID=A0A2T3ZTA2_TRIHA|nr:hypothetical protein M431DRAFT_100751 [Trichoderma harzianum CBS 226.95]KAK0755555.1 hypothetical protein N5P37_011957 [Trichoderma harzianum]PKK47400.1 hypothetical protein CI102_8836 [Trichoderma harzianum]PTB48025.1 hypothetical protein M431DRAFT_100751 [Trichoderma harzianum CBS 226.95]